MRVEEVIRMFYDQSKQEVMRLLDSDQQQGLAEEEVLQRLKRDGYNRLKQEEPPSVIHMLIQQISDPMMVILFIGAAISMLLHEYSDAIIILAVVMLNAIIGVVQEYRAEQTIRALQQLSNPKTTVKRDGKVKIVESPEVVIGDVVFLEAGKYVSADMRLLASSQLSVDESSLTGESENVEKDDDVILASDTPLADQKNMVFASTYITKGNGWGVVCATGMQSEVGKIASMMKASHTDLTPLQKRFKRLGKTLGGLAVVICVIMIAVGIWQKRELLSLLITSISLAVAAIPEGLPAVCTIVLAVGVQRMSKVHAVARKMHAVETLGNVTTICSDKTGTLTQNQMRVVQYAAPFEETDNVTLFLGMSLCNHAGLEQGKGVGEGTEAALKEWAFQHGIGETLLANYSLLYELPFDSQRKRMTTVHTCKHLDIAFTKGAYDAVVPLCTHIEINGRRMVLGNEELAKLDQQMRSMSEQALRVLVLAKKEGFHLPKGQADQQLTFIGMVGLMDPPKPRVKEAIQQAKQAGIDTIMITGDHPLTAYAIARDLHIASDPKQVMTGSELDQIDDARFKQVLPRIRVFARVTPEHKVRIVTVLKQMGKVVAMTGDGINDAPSLKKADVGIAMGIQGTDVSKEAADLVLFDDNFSTILLAIEEGRNIFQNIQKAMLYLLSCNIGEIFALFGSIVLLPHVALPLNAIQILWVNLITDTFPALALGMEPKDPTLMQQLPRKASEALFHFEGWYFMILNGLLIGTLTVISYRYGMNDSIGTAHTMAFMTLSITQLFHAFNLRSLSRPIVEAGIFNNKILNLVFVFSMMLQIGITYVPWTQKVLRVSVLSVDCWCVVIGCALVVILINEISKRFGIREEKN